MKILVFDVPGLHLGYLGCYGNDWIATPNIDRLASASVVFDRHFYDVAQPGPFAMTGHHPLPTLEPASFPAAATLGEILDERGIARELISANSTVSIDSLEDIVAKTRMALARAALAGGRSFTWVRWPALAPPWQLPDELLDSYCEEEDEPWPDPPQGVLENAHDLPRLQSTYAAVVTYVDAQLGVLVHELQAHSQLDDTLICLTATWGLPLGEHGTLGFPSPGPYEEFVHLPLLVRVPGAEAGGARLDALTQPVDLFPTLLEFLGITPPPSHGHSLGALIRAEAGQVRPYACSGMHTSETVDWSLRTLDWAFLLPVTSPAKPPRPPRLFVKPDDRWEVNDVHQHHPELTDEMDKTLRAFAERTRKPGLLRST